MPPPAVLLACCGPGVVVRGQQEPISTPNNGPRFRSALIAHSLAGRHHNRQGGDIVTAIAGTVTVPIVEAGVVPSAVGLQPTITNAVGVVRLGWCVAE